jgi:site-specific DNA-methyltransferase (adenine-specific)
VTLGKCAVQLIGRGAAIGLSITLEEPTKDMTQEAITSDVYHSPGWNKDFPRIQILTIAQLLKGVEVKMPPAYGTFKQAEKVQQRAAEQLDLLPDK